MNDPFQFFIFFSKILYSFHKFILRHSCTSGLSQIFTFGRNLTWFSFLATVGVLEMSTAFVHHNIATNTTTPAARMWTTCTHYLRGSQTSRFRHGDVKNIRLRIQLMNWQGSFNKVQLNPQSWLKSIWDSWNELNLHENTLTLLKIDFSRLRILQIPIRRGKSKIELRNSELCKVFTSNVPQLKPYSTWTS